MWYLMGPTGELIYIKVNKELTFGRKKSDIILQNDDSVSRLHASLCIVPKDIVAKNGIISNCVLKDLGSKYGTYVLSDDLSIAVTKEGYNLNDQDKIRFGLQQHVFTVHYKPIITVVSALNKDDKEKLQNLMNEIDGLISSEWINMCTHLTVSMATLTEKVTWAMTCVKPIVNVDYWVEVKSAIDEGKEIPKFTNFVPDIGEEFVNKEKASLLPNEQRKTLFTNLVFVYFSTRQYKTYGKMINMAGGKSILYTKHPLNNKDICSVNVVVLQYSCSDSSQSTQCLVPEYDSIYDILQKNKRRMISELEIPLAILHCSVDTYCNPKFKFSKLFKRSQTKYDTADIVALDTQDLLSDVRILPKVISNVPVKSAINVKPVKKKTTVIPETYETPSSSMAFLNDVESQHNIEPKVAENYIPETSTYQSTCSIVDKNKRNDERLEIAKKKTKFIPETMDTYDFTSTEKSTNKNIPVKGTQTVIPESLSTQSNEQIDSMVSKRRLPLKDVIVISVEDDDELREKQRSKTKPDENLKKVLLKEKVENLQSVRDIRVTSLEESREKTDSSVEKRHVSKPNDDRSKTTKILQERDKDKEKCNIILEESSVETESVVKRRHAPTSIQGRDKTTEKLQEREKNKEKCNIILDESSDETESLVEKRHPPTSIQGHDKTTEKLQEREMNKEKCNIILDESSDETESLVEKRHPPTLIQGHDKTTEKLPQREKNKEKCIIILEENSNGREQSVEERGPFKLNTGQDKTTEKLQEREKNKEKRKIIMEKSNEEAEPLVAVRHSPKPKKARHKVPKILQEWEKSKEERKKGEKRFNEFDNEEVHSTVRKKSHIDNSTEDASFKSPLVTSTPRFNTDKNVSNSLIRKNSSFFRQNMGSKTFQKVYTNVPTKRITLKEMYVWHGGNSVN